MILKQFYTETSKLLIQKNQYTFKKIFLNLNPQNIVMQRCCNIHSSNQRQAFINEYAEELKKKKKTFNVPKIKLIDENDNISLVTLVDAEKLAKRRGLKVTRIEDPKRVSKTKTQVYQLISETEFIKTTVNIMETKEKNKTIVIHSKIQEGDFQTKLKKITNILSKQKVALTVLLNGSWVGKNEMSERVQELIKEMEEYTFDVVECESYVKININKKNENKNTQKKNVKNENQKYKIKNKHIVTEDNGTEKAANIKNKNTGNEDKDIEEEEANINNKRILT